MEITKIITAFTLIAGITSFLIYGSTRESKWAFASIIFFQLAILLSIIAIGELSGIIK